MLATELFLTETGGPSPNPDPLDPFVVDLSACLLEHPGNLAVAGTASRSRDTKLGPFVGDGIRVRRVLFRTEKAAEKRKPKRQVHVHVLQRFTRPLRPDAIEEARHLPSGFFSVVRSEFCMAWSTSDISTLKMSFFWNDSAEDVAFILGKDVAEVQAKARELGIHLQTLRSYVPRASASSAERTTA